MAGGGRTYYATGTGRFSKGSEIRADAASIRTATRKGEMKVLTSFGTTQDAPEGTLSKEQLLKVLRSGDTVKFGDGTSVKINAENKIATVNRLVSEGQRQIAPAQPRTGSILGGQFRGQPTQAPKPVTPTAKPAPRATPKPASKPSAKPSGKPVPRQTRNPNAPKPAPKPATKPSAKPSASPSKKGGATGGKKTPSAQAKKGGKTGGKDRTSGSRKGRGLISGAGVVYTGNRRKGGGGKKDRKRGIKKRKGGRSGRGRRS